jgi:trigger factor
LFVNVTVENLAPCKKLVRFEVEVQQVDETFKAVAKDYQRHAALPGFRAGKAPEEMVLKKFEKDIADEVKRKLMSNSYQQAIKDHKLTVVGYPDVEEIQFGRGQALQFAATIETAPEFQLPEYRGLPAKRETAIVTEADMEGALNALRGQQAKFEKVDRPAQEGDFVVVNYHGSAEGKPISEIAPAARGLTEQKNFWVEVKKDSFIPGFSEQLIGAKAGDKRTVNVDFPADFVTPQLAGKKGVYEVELVEVKVRLLPELNDAFAVSYGAETLEKLREGVRSDLQNELNLKQKRSIRSQVVGALLSRVSFELPESTVQQETRSVVYNLVNDYQKRGAPKEVIDQQKDEIYSLASQTAKERVKAGFLFQKIAEKEGVRVLEQEVNARIVTLAQSYQMAPQKLVKELEKNDGVAEIYRQLLQEKVIDFLQEHAKIEDVAPAPASPSP